MTVPHWVPLIILDVISPGREIYWLSGYQAFSLLDGFITISFSSGTFVNLCHCFSSSWCRRLAAASACGSSWTFLFTLFGFYLWHCTVWILCEHRCEKVHIRLLFVWFHYFFFLIIFIQIWYRALSFWLWLVRSPKLLRVIRILLYSCLYLSFPVCRHLFQSLCLCLIFKKSSIFV